MPGRTLLTAMPLMTNTRCGHWPTPISAELLTTQGVRLINLDDGEKLICLVKVAESEDDAAEEGDEAAANLEAGEGAAE